MVHTARRHFPDLEILARAFDWQDAHELLAAGVTHVYREALDTSLRVGTDALRLLGFRAYQAQRAAQRFFRYDEQALRELTAERGDTAVYISLARQRIEELERMLRADLAAPPLDRDAGWDAESLREEANAAERRGRTSGDHVTGVGPLDRAARLAMPWMVLSVARVRPARHRELRRAIATASATRRTTCQPSWRSSRPGSSRRTPRCSNRRGGSASSTTCWRRWPGRPA